MLNWVISIAFLLIILGFVAWGVRRIKPPDVKLTSVRPERLAAGAQRLVVGLRVLNPNPLPLPVQSMTYELWLEDRSIASGQGKLHRRVPARGAADMQVLVTGDARHLARTLPKLALTPQPWHYRLEGKVAVLPRIWLPYRHEGRIDLAGMLRLAASLR
jgi:LEA14-like dessication related protein